MISGKWHLAGGLLLAVAVLGLGDARAANLDKALLSEAGALLEALAKKEIKTVGVLPFRVKKGGREAGYDAAPLAVGLPGRLENALIVSQGGTDKTALRILRDAAAGAAKAKVGPWATDEAAFAKLFDAEYEPAWGTKAVKPDGFLLGDVISSPDDRATTRIEVRLITRDSSKGGKLVSEKLRTIDVQTDRSLLRDLGYAYAVPRAMIKKKGAGPKDLDDSAIEQVNEDEKAAKAAKTDKPPVAKRAPSHTPDDVAGFKVEVEYDGVKQPIQVLEAGYRVAAAKPGQKVVVYLTRVAADDVKLGVVLKVNGLSTFNEEEGESIGCKKWIYAADRKGKRDDFAGFYSRGTGSNLTLKPFKVLTKEESDAKMLDMGPRAGWIDVDVFASGGATVAKGEKEEELLLSTRGAVKARGATMKAVQEQVAKANNLKLLKSDVTARGGLITRGTESLDADPYKSDDLPNPRRIGGISIQYYEPPGKVVD